MTRTSNLFASLTLGLALLGGVATAHAAPQTLLFEGSLRSVGGSPAADGAYDLTVSLYADATTKEPLWSEALVGVQVKGGAVAIALGTTKAIDDAALTSAAWLGVRVGAEPELPRVALHATAFARRSNVASVAADLQCSGCVGSNELAFDGDLDLGGHSVKAKNGVYSGDLSAKSLTAQAVTAQTVTGQSFIGDGSKLTGIGKVSGTCKTGEAVIGVGADGVLQCKAMGVAGGKLGDLTGGLLTNEFKTVAKPNSLPLPIPDNSGAEAAALANILETGAVQSITVIVEVQNSDLSKVRMVLLPPEDKVKGMTLCDPCGGLNEKSFVGVYPTQNKPKEGDLAAYVGKSAKGLWTLKVLDTGFCVPQLPGNKALCNLDNGTDGTVTNFEVQVTVLSQGAVNVPGTLYATGSFVMPTDPAQLPGCSIATKGMTFSDTKKARLVTCDGADWRTVAFQPACGNAIKSGEEECDDGNQDNTDACTDKCKIAVCGDGHVQGGKEVCDDGNTQNGDVCAGDCSKITGKMCSNGSGTDCNPAGQTLVGTSAFVDQTLPADWVQCMGFINTAGNDVGPNAMDNCLKSTKLRLRIWDQTDKLRVDVWMSGVGNHASWWNGGQYYGGGNLNMILCEQDMWPCNNTAPFYGSSNGTCGGGCGGYPAGQCLSNGNGGQVTVNPGGNGADELTKGPCYGGTNYTTYKIAVYKQP